MSSPFLYSSAIAAQTNLSTTRSDSHDRSPTSSNTFSPAVIAVIGILGAAFLLVSYYTMVAKFCTSRRGHGFFGRSRQIRRNANINDLLLDMANNGEQIVWPSFPQRGLSDGEIEKLPVIEYRKTSLSSPSSSSSSSSSSDEDSMSKSMAKDLSRTMQGKPPDQIPPKACIGMRLSYIDEEGKTAVETSVLNEEGKLAMETSLPDDKGGKLAMMKTLPVVDEGGKVAMETSPVDTAEEDKSMIMSSEERKSLRVCDNQIVVCGSSDCAVCLCEFEDGEMVRVLPRCGHGFHFGCIYMWLHSHPNCPVCRTHVLTNPESSADDSEILPPLEDQDLIHDPTSIISTAHSSPNPDLQPLHIIDEGEAEDVDDDGQQLVRLRPQNHEQKKITDSSYNMKENRDLPMAADQVEHDTNVWDLGLGLELRCFSASRASMSRFVGSHEDDEDHKGLGFDDTERGVIRRSRSLIFHIGHNGSLNVQTHGRQDRVHTTVDIKKLITSSSSSSSVPLSSSSSLVPSSSSSLVPSSSSSLVPSSSSSSSLVPLSSSSLVPSSSSSLVPSSSSSLIPSCLPISVRPSDATHHDDATAAASIMRDDYKSKSFNSNYEDEMKTLGSDPFMARMAHSLRCTRVVRRSFSGGKLFGFKGAQQRSTSSSSSNSEAIPPRLPI